MFDKLKKFFSNDEEKQVVIDYDKKTGIPLYKEDIIAQIVNSLNERKEARHPLENQWNLNNNFISGNQFCDINTATQTIEQEPEVYEWMERETFNRISSIVETRISNLKKLNFVMSVKPRTNELEDYQKAEVSTSILRYLQSNSNFEDIKNVALWWNEICGSVFFLSWWNPAKGEEVGRIQAIQTVEKGSEESTENDIDKFVERAIYEGDIDYGIITAYEIYPENLLKQTVEEQRSIIIEQVKTVDEIYDMYGIDVDGEEVDCFSLGQVEMSTGYGSLSTVNTVTHVKVKNASKVITYFERPSRRNPNGRIAIIVGEKELVYYGDLPYKDIPIVKMVSKEVAGQFFGKSVIQEMIPLQRAYNGVVNRIHEYIKDLIYNGYLVEDGAIDIDDFEANGREPGALIVYSKGHQPPIPIPNSQMPATVINEKHELEQNMEYVAGVSQLMVYGKTPNGVTSGTAIENLREIDNTRLALTGDCIRSAVINLAKDWLYIYKSFANTKRVINVCGLNDIGGALVWCNNDINSYDIKFETDNELILSEALQRERFIEAFQMGLFTDEKGAIPQKVKQKMLDVMKIGNYSDMMSMYQLQRQAAQRENTLFENGVMPQITMYDDNDVHIEEHTRYILQMRFKMLKNKKPEYASVMENHLKMHMDIKDFKDQEDMRMMMSGGAPVG